MPITTAAHAIIRSACPPDPPCPLDPTFSCGRLSEARREREQLQQAREEIIVAATERRHLLERQDQQMRHMQLLGQEADHRLLNGLQLVASLLALQARRTTSPEAAIELQVASRRVATIGNLHRQLHGVDDALVVELDKYVGNICHEVAEMIGAHGHAGTISFRGASLRTHRALAISLGFICAELLTNAVKYADGDIAVTLQDASDGRWALSVTDQGPGLPEGFDPAAATGLGMKIIASLVKDVNGELLVGGRDELGGARFTVAFPAVPVLAENENA